MQLIIHRGAKQIGGSCVEISTPLARIIIDVGLPLDDVTEAQKPKFRLERGKPIPEGLAPVVDGLFAAGRKVDAIFSGHRERGPTEKELEVEIAGHVKGAEGLVCASFSPMHVDRFVSFYKAARKQSDRSRGWTRLCRKHRSVLAPPPRPGPVHQSKKVKLLPIS